MMRKLIISGFLIILLLFSLTGCNSSPKTNPLGSKQNPIVLKAEGEPYPSVSYNGHVGKEMLYIKATGLPNTLCSIMLNNLEDNADLYVYPDATFTTPSDESTEFGITDEYCDETPNGAQVKSLLR